MTYTDDTGDYDVQTGDVWFAGPHVVICGSALDTVTLLQLRQYVDGVRHVAFCDLPFNQAHTTRFHRLADRRDPVTHREVVNALIIAALANQPVAAYFEYATDTALVEDLLGLPHMVARGTYSSGHVGYVMCGKHLADLDGQRDRDAPTFVALHHQLPVLDVCAGRGLTPLAAARAGVDSYSVELVPRRAAIILQKFATLGHEPTLHERNA
jgi:hypothetical protein